MKERQGMNFRELLNLNKQKDIYFFGTGGVFRTVLDRHSDIIKSMSVKGVFDNDSSKWGSKQNGIDVLNPQKIECCKEDDIIIITSSFINEIQYQISKYNLPNVYSYNWLEGVGRMYDAQEIKQLDQVKQYLEDDKSKNVIDTIVENRRTGNGDFSNIYEENQYFVDDIISFNSNEVLIDGGAYIGDTMEIYLQKCDNQFKKIYAFEPDDNNYLKLKQIYQSDNRIELIHAGLGRKHEELYFLSNGSSNTAGTVAQDGDYKVVIDSIDEKVKDEVSFIKMDIEGYELDALKGARNTILQYKPKLAICVYHKAEDLYEIPQYIRELVPEYKLYLRHHSKGIAETVLYAVIEEDQL